MKIDLDELYKETEKNLGKDCPKKVKEQQFLFDLEHEYQTIKEIANGFGKKHIKINEKYDS